MSDREITNDVIKLNSDPNIYCTEICSSPHWSYGNKCRTTAYVIIENRGMCKKHANKYVLDEIVKGNYRLVKNTSHYL